MNETQLNELAGRLHAKRQEWQDFYAGFKAVGDQQAKTMTGEDVTRFKAYEAEVADLQGQYEQAKSIYDAAESNRKAMADGERLTPVSAGAPTGAQQKTLAEVLLAKAGGSLMSVRNRGDIDLNDVNARAWLGLEAKTTMTTGANGFPPEVLRDGTVVPIIQRPPQLIDFLRIEPTTANAIKFMKQTVRTNAVAAKSEGSALDESVITYAESTDIISRIGTFIPITEEQLEDEPGVQALVSMDLAMMVRQKLDTDITVGSGTDPVLLGIYNSTSYQTQAKGSNTTPDAIGLAMKAVQLGAYARPNLVVMHVTDLWNLALTRTADGVYLLGNPTDGIIRRIWGVPIAQSEALTAGNAMVLDTDYFSIKMRKGVTIAISDSHSTNFTSNILVIRAHVRAGIKHLRGEAICRVTGL